MNMLVLLLCALVSVTYAQDGLQVKTTEGVIEGSRVAIGNYSYHVFYDIPYGGPTSGENRFKAPTPPPIYPGVFHAVNNNVICAQPSSRGLIGTENCLTLSIYTNNVTTPKLVFVWINSEEYTTTTTPLYSYSRIVEEGIVFVSLNFRVSIFGFLCLGVPEAPGNAGLKDIIQGLNWIKSNIAGFGGNPDNIVLVGHGSGAALVDLITLSPRSVNLVHKAIALSGSALAPWAVAYDPVGYAKALGARLSYNKKTSQELAKLLKTTDVNVLASALNNFKFTNNTPLFAPCVENVKLNPNETVVIDAPINQLRSGNYSHVPYISGYTTREGSLRAGEAAVEQWLEKMQANFTDFLPVDLRVGVNASAVAQSIRQFYFSDSPINMATIEDYLDFHGDTLVLVSVIRAARERGTTSRSEVRLIEFGYKGTLNSDWPYNQIPLTGVRHGGFLNYLFDYDLRADDENVRNSLLTRFSRFAYTGEPTSNVTWPAINANALNYLYYGGNDVPGTNFTPIFVEEVRINPHTTRMTFWNNTYTKYYEPPRPVSSAGKIMSFAFVIMLCQYFVFLF